MADLALIMRSEVLLVLTYKLSATSCCRVNFSNDQMILFSKWAKANILNRDLLPPSGGKQLSEAFHGSIQVLNTMG